VKLFQYLFGKNRACSSLSLVSWIRKKFDRVDAVLCHIVPRTYRTLNVGHNLDYHSVSVTPYSY
jgi:hypothetical protein